MRVREVRALPLAGGVTGAFGSIYREDEHNLYTLIEVVTDEGVAGLGSVYTSGKLVEGALAAMRPFLIGASALDPAATTETLHQHTFRQGRGGAVTHAVSGVDIALWDILGKVTGQPIGRLLGGRLRETIKPYASILMTEPAELRERLLAAKALGFKAFKIAWGPFGRVSRALDETLVRTARDAVGDDVDLMLDAGASDAFWGGDLKWAMNTARMLAEHGVAFFEEPLDPDDIEAFVTLTANSPVPIAGCELLTRRQSFLPWIERRAVDYVQPDVTRVGGISEQHRIQQYAADHGIELVPHGWNTAVGVAADLQLVSAAARVRWIEYATPAPYIDELFAERPRLDAEGLVQIPIAPGLGMAWDPDGIARYTGGQSLTPSAL